jgi:hypothetical protein
MTSLKKLLSPFGLEEKRVWSTFLSTIYGQSMVAQGQAAALLDTLQSLSTLPQDATRTRAPSFTSSSRRKATLQAQLLLETLQELSSILGDASWMPSEAQDG